MPGMTAKDILALDSLRMAISQSGKNWVAIDEWKKVFNVQMGDAPKSTKSMAFSRSMDKLFKAGVCAVEAGRISLVAGDESD